MIFSMWFKRILFLLIAGAIGLSLSGCWFIYRPDIKQGNTLTLQKVNAIHPGMTKEQVKALLGSPILVNVFAPDQMIYVYTIQPGHGHFQAQQLRIYFEQGRVSHYTSNVH
jgi:outer membrane protein assembly factor BamE